MIKHNVQGNIAGVRDAMLARLDALYSRELEEDVIPVSGEREEMSNRLEDGAPVPVSGPVAMTIRFSGPSGSSLPVRLSYRILDAITFALYGQSSGGTRDDLVQLRCNRCNPADPTFVKFVFYHGIYL